MTVVKMNAGKMTAGKMTAGKMTVGKMTVGQMTVGQVTGRQNDVAPVQLLKSYGTKAVTLFFSEGQSKHKKLFSFHSDK